MATKRSHTKVIPNRSHLEITGRYTLDELMVKGLLPPPSAAMRADLALHGVRFQRAYAVRLGDVVATVTRWLGVPMCAGCERRKHAMNRITVWGWWR